MNATATKQVERVCGIRATHQTENAERKKVREMLRLYQRQETRYGIPGRNSEKQFDEPLGALERYEDIRKEQFNRILHPAHTSDQLHGGSLHHRGFAKLRTPPKEEALYREDSTTTKEDKGSESLLQIQRLQALDTGPRRDLRCRHEGCARNMEFFQTQRLRDIIQHSPARLSENVVIHERGKADTCTKTHVAIMFANQSHKVEDAPWKTNKSVIHAV